MAKIKDLLRKPALLSPGIYHRVYENKDGIYRLHLRVEKDGTGILTVNAARILFLNQTATEYARYIIDGMSEEEIVRKIHNRYRVKRSEALEDFRRIDHTIKELAKIHEDECPVTMLDISLKEDADHELSAPHRIDLALTYKCDNDCKHCYVERKQKGPELSTDEWKKVMDKIWEIGVPHICFTGGEATLRKDLVDLITYAEDVGLVSGLLTNGRAMKDKNFVKRMVDAGIDHFQLTLLSHDEKIHNTMMGSGKAWAETVQGIKNAVATPVYTLTNTTLTKFNVKDIEKTVRFLADLGVNAFACNGIIKSGKGRTLPEALTEKELKPVVGKIRNEAEKLNLRFIWYSPTEYCHFDPIESEVGLKFCTAAKYNLCIEPDGVVLPCQSFFAPLGNILKDSWDSIWNHKLSQTLRDRLWVEDKCHNCPEMSSCGGGCPLNLPDKALKELKKLSGI
jgi:radical SAM protein with 4Fe4S-binding SPASM domain